MTRREGSRKLTWVAAVALWGAVASGMAAEPVTGNLPRATNAVMDSAMMAKVAEGHRLFDHNCAHCHGEDARGDEGPDLHGLKKSDERLHKLIMNGIKGEMPAFGKKFKDADVEALIAFLRTLKE
jgi:mono/diheme cytochrome c family protein